MDYGLKCFAKIHKKIILTNGILNFFYFLQANGLKGFYLRTSLVYARPRSVWTQRM